MLRLGFHRVDVEAFSEKTFATESLIIVNITSYEFIRCQSIINLHFVKLIFLFLFLFFHIFKGYVKIYYF